MSEKEENEKTDEQKTGKTLSLKRTVDSGQVRQNFSHGRTKSVQVERKRKRMVAPGNVAAPSSAMPSATEPVETIAPEVKEQTSENNLGGLSRQEQAARQAAVAEAKVRAAEEKISNAINSMPHGITMWDKDMKLLMINDFGNNVWKKGNLDIKIGTSYKEYLELSQNKNFLIFNNKEEENIYYEKAIKNRNKLEGVFTTETPPWACFILFAIS